MFRESSPPFADIDIGPSEPIDQGLWTSRLGADVHAAFPNIDMSQTRLEDSGGDHIILIVGEQYAFRFPRSDHRGLELELRALSALQMHRSLATPTYEYADPLGRFGGYRLIPGLPLTCDRFTELAVDKRRLVLADLAAFLSVFHGLDKRKIAPDSAWPRAWGAKEYADRLTSSRLPLIRQWFPRLAAPAAAFVANYRSDRAPALVVVHGDLVTDHILFDGDAARVTGVIDFGDVALGDPALDIAGCWRYGTEAVVDLIALYASPDPGMLARSRNHFIRYEIDRLFDELVEGKSASISEERVSELTMMLARYHS